MLMQGRFRNNEHEDHVKGNLLKLSNIIFWSTMAIHTCKLHLYKKVTKKWKKIVIISTPVSWVIFSNFYKSRH